MRIATSAAAAAAPRDVTRVVGYIRVSTAEQADSGLGLEAQRVAIEAACTARGWELVELLPDDESARSLRRPVLVRALGMLDSGAADVLMVAKLDRLTRSLKDFCELVERATIVALDSPADPTTVHGEAMQSMQVVFSQLERRLIGQRTREAMAILRAQGVRLGRPRVLPQDIRDRIKRERYEDGRSWSEIARRLTAEGIPTGHGAAKWSHVTVRKVALSPV